MGVVAISLFSSFPTFPSFFARITFPPNPTPDTLNRSKTPCPPLFSFQPLRHSSQRFHISVRFLSFSIFVFRYCTMIHYFRILLLPKEFCPYFIFHGPPPSPSSRRTRILMFGSLSDSSSFFDPSYCLFRLRLFLNLYSLFCLLPPFFLDRGS